MLICLRLYVKVHISHFLKQELTQQALELLAYSQYSTGL